MHYVTVRGMTSVVSEAPTRPLEASIRRSVRSELTVCAEDTGRGGLYRFVEVFDASGGAAEARHRGRREWSRETTAETGPSAWLRPGATGREGGGGEWKVLPEEGGLFVLRWWRFKTETGVALHVFSHFSQCKSIAAVQFSRSKMRVLPFCSTRQRQWCRQNTARRY